VDLFSLVAEGVKGALRQLSAPRLNFGLVAPSAAQCRLIGLCEGVIPGETRRYPTNGTGSSIARSEAAVTRDIDRRDADGFGGLQRSVSGRSDSDTGA